MLSRLGICFGRLVARLCLTKAGRRAGAAGMLRNLLAAARRVPA